MNEQKLFDYYKELEHRYQQQGGRILHFIEDAVGKRDDLSYDELQKVVVLLEHELSTQ